MSYGQEEDTQPCSTGDGCNAEQKIDACATEADCNEGSERPMGRPEKERCVYFIETEGRAFVKIEYLATLNRPYRTDRGDVPTDSYSIDRL
jgi:hypothetical protein